MDVSLKSLGSIPTFRLDYYLAKKHSLKLFYTPAYTMVDVENKNDSEYSSSKTFQGTYSMQLGLGYESHFLPKSKFDPFVGVSIAYLYSGKSKEILEELGVYSNSGIEERYQSKSINTGVESHGIHSSIVLGGNYFILKNFSLGAAFNLAYNYRQQKGEAERTNDKSLYRDGVLVYENNSVNNFDVNYTSKGLVYSATIKAAYYFNFAKKKQSEL